MLDKIKTYLDIKSPDQDALLSIMIENAEAAFTNYTNRDAAEYQTIILKMVVEDYNRYGSEGISNLSFGNTKSEEVLGDYTEGLRRQIRRLKKVRVI